MTNDRYHRQFILPQIGMAGQHRLSSARVLLIGCGALGCNVAQQLVRAGVGSLRIVDRDLVDMTNLHRQVLFTEEDARRQLPKAMAAAGRLREANSGVTIEPIVADVDSSNVAQLAGDVRVIVDGTDNAQVRFLINDVSVKLAIPWVYGACVGVEGRVMAFTPGKTPCLRCLFPEPPAAGELATCDTAGVLGPAAAIVGAQQAAMCIRLIVGQDPIQEMLAIDAWGMRYRTISTEGARREDCRCCAKREFEFIDRPPAAEAASLCGRNAVQVRPARRGDTDLAALSQRLANVGTVENMGIMLRCTLAQHGVRMSIFGDGRVIVDGTNDVALARTLVARYVGS